MLLHWAIFYLIWVYSVAALIAPPITDAWENFKVLFNKTYNSTEEEHYRRKVFSENLEYIEKHNINYQNELSSFEMGMNQYGDLTQGEFEERMLGLSEADQELREAALTLNEETRRRGDGIGSSLFAALQEKLQDLPPLSALLRLFKTAYMKAIEDLLEPGMEERNRIVDWVLEGAVTPAKDQGFCGSCWAFSAVGALEAAIYRATGKLVPLSVQNLVDCTLNETYNNLGCEGGIMATSFRYVIDNGGIAAEKYYPYQGKQGEECSYEEWMSAGHCRGMAEIEGQTQILRALAEKGPLSVVMDAASIQFRFYRSGLYDHKCSHTTLGTNHAVLLVGYGQWSDGRGYWHLKNSWGTAWGQDGFARLSRDTSCGIQHYAIYPIV